MLARVVLQPKIITKDDSPWEEASFNSFLEVYPEQKKQFMVRAKNIIDSALSGLNEGQRYAVMKSRVAYDPTNDLFIVDFVVPEEHQELSEEELEEKIKETLDLGPDTWMEGDITLWGEESEKEDNPELGLEFVSVELY